jgi:hypothetical protein
MMRIRETFPNWVTSRYWANALAKLDAWSWLAHVSMSTGIRSGRGAFSNSGMSRVLAALFIDVP